jgi:DNA repair ATPase RecN
MSDMDDELREIVAAAPKSANAPTPAELANAKLKEKIPGLELTFGDAEELALTESDIGQLQEIKKKYEIPVHLLRTIRGAYAIKECTRIEWRNKMLEYQRSLGEAREQMTAEGRDPTYIESILNMLLQEKVVSWLLIYPTIDSMSVRRMPPGEVETIFNGIMMALGFNQPTVPIKL